MFVMFCVKSFSCSMLHVAKWMLKQSKGVRKGVEVKPHTLSLIFYKTLLPAQRRLIVFAYFLLVICRLNANTTEQICMKISRNIVNGPKSNNYLLVGIPEIVCVQKPPHHFLQSLHPLRMFKIVFRDSSLYPKQVFHSKMSAKADQRKR